MCESRYAIGLNRNPPLEYRGYAPLEVVEGRSSGLSFFRNHRQVSPQVISFGTNPGLHSHSVLLERKLSIDESNFRTKFFS
jgi:hypothetical protein